LADPRLTVLATGAFRQGPTVWEPTQRGMLDIGCSVDLRPAIEPITQGLVEIPGSGSPDPVPTTRRMER